MTEARYARINRRKCGCTQPEHRHGCRNRYDKGCHCDTCRQGHRDRARAKACREISAADLEYLKIEFAHFAGYRMHPERLAAHLGMNVRTVEARLARAGTR
jgi:hypothetical protein